MNPSQELDEIKIIFACGECTYATTNRLELDSHLLTVHEKSQLLKYDHEPSAQRGTLQYMAPGPIVLAPINSQVRTLVIVSNQKIMTH